MYEVIKNFVDLQDGDHLYKTGDKFPREGVEVKKSRIDELLSFSNMVGVPLIKEKEKAESRTLSEAAAINNKPLTENVQTYTKTDIARMNKETLVKLANDKGIRNAETMSGNALKSALVQRLGL